MPSRSKRLFGVSLIALAAIPLVIGSLRITSRIIVPEGDVVEEDLYAFGELVLIEGTIRGDLFAVAGELRVTGSVEGDVIALVGGPVEIAGEVDGAVRVAAIRQMVREAQDANPKLIVVIQTSPQAQYGVMIDILDELKMAHIRKISIKMSKS